MPTLFKSDYAVVEHAIASRVVRVIRANKQFDSGVAARSEVARWGASVDGLEVSKLGFLLDWRLGPLTTDSDVLREVVLRTNEIGVRFKRQAVLMATPLGVLQAQRLQRAHESEPEIFTDEAQAYAYVMGH